MPRPVLLGMGGQGPWIGDRGVPALARTLLALAATALVLSAPARVDAEPAPRLRLQVTGACPSQRALDQRLRAAGVAVAAQSERAGWRVRVTSAKSGSLLELFDRGGARVLHRQIESRDCAAVARAFAAIVRMQLQVLPAALPESDAIGSSERDPAEPIAARPSAAPVEAIEPGPERASPARSGRDVDGGAARPERGLPLQRSSSEAAAGRPGLRAAVDEVAPSHARLWVGAAGGVQVAAEPLSPTLLGHLHLAWRPKRSGLVWRVAAAAAANTTQGTDTMRITSQESQLRIDAGWRLTKGRWFAEPAVGAAVQTARVTAVDLPDEPSVRRWQPLLTGSVGAGLRVTSRLWLRSDLGLAVAARRDEYEIDPVGVVARSGRLRGWVSLGVEMAVDFGID